MKFTTTLLTLTATLALGFHGFAADDDTPLSKEMSGLNKQLRTLKKQIADTSKKDDNVKLVEGMKEHLTKAKDLEPATAKDVAADKKADYIAKYKQQIDATAKDFDSLEEAIKGDKADDAKKVLEKLQKDKEQGHKDFKAEDK
jgi:thymidylate synthase